MVPSHWRNGGPIKLASDRLMLDTPYRVQGGSALQGHNIRCQASTEAVQCTELRLPTDSPLRAPLHKAGARLLEVPRQASDDGSRLGVSLA